MRTVIVTMRDGEQHSFVDGQTLAERAIDGDLDEQFLLFTDDDGSENLIPADDIAMVKSWDRG